MKALLLAAGLGTRLRPLTETVPKCLVPIRQKPLIDYWFELLLDTGAIERILVNTHWLSDKVRTHVAASRWRDKVDLVHEDDLLGTGGTVLANSAWLAPGPFLVAHADNLTNFDALEFIAAHKARPAGTDITMMTFVTDDPSSCGIVETDSRGVVTAFHEKVANPPGNLANAAVYIFEPAVVAFMKGLNRPVVDLSTEVILKFVDRIWAFRQPVYNRDIGTMQSLERAEREFAEILSKLRAQKVAKR